MQNCNHLIQRKIIPIIHGTFLLNSWLTLCYEHYSQGRVDFQLIPFSKLDSIRESPLTRVPENFTSFMEPRSSSPNKCRPGTIRGKYKTPFVNTYKLKLLIFSLARDKSFQLCDTHWHRQHTRERPLHVRAMMLWNVPESSLTFNLWYANRVWKANPPPFGLSGNKVRLYARDFRAPHSANAPFMASLLRALH